MKNSRSEAPCEAKMLNSRLPTSTLGAEGSEVLATLQLTRAWMPPNLAVA